MRHRDLLTLGSVSLFAVVPISGLSACGKARSPNAEADQTSASAAGGFLQPTGGAPSAGAAGKGAGGRASIAAGVTAGLGATAAGSFPDGGIGGSVGGAGAPQSGTSANAGSEAGGHAEAGSSGESVAAGGLSGATVCHGKASMDPTLECPDAGDLPRPPAVVIDHISPAYEGELQRCDGFDPFGTGFRFRFRVDAIKEREGGARPEFAFFGANVDVNPPCGHALIVSGDGLKHRITPGLVLTLSERITLSERDADTYVTYAIESDKQELLVAWVMGARPSAYHGDLLAGLEPTIEPGQVCLPRSREYALGTMRLTAPNDGGTCVVDSNSVADCCRFWGDAYTLTGDGVIVGEDTRRTTPSVYFTLYRQDFIELSR